MGHGDHESPYDEGSYLAHMRAMDAKKKAAAKAKNTGPLSAMKPGTVRPAAPAKTRVSASSAPAKAARKSVSTKPTAAAPKTSPKPKDRTASATTKGGTRPATPPRADSPGYYGAPADSGPVPAMMKARGSKPNTGSDMRPAGYQKKNMSRGPDLETFGTGPSPSGDVAVHSRLYRDQRSQKALVDEYRSKAKAAGKRVNYADAAAYVAAGQKRRGR